MKSAKWKTALGGRRHDAADMRRGIEAQ